MGRCIDLGCGAGKYLHRLSMNFRTVVACDLSPKLIGLSRQEVKQRKLSNVEVRVRDLASVWYRPDAGAEEAADAELFIPESFGFAVMANVLIAPGPTALRALMLRNAYRSLCVGGRLLVIVPSLESALYVNMRCEEAAYEGPYTGWKQACVNGDVVQQPTRAQGADILQGIFKRSGVRTKHYLEPEFTLLVERVGFKVESIEKVTYTWGSELGLYSDLHLPKAFREPSPPPWDWLFVLRKEEGKHSVERCVWGYSSSVAARQASADRAADIDPLSARESKQPESNGLGSIEEVGLHAKANSTDAQAPPPTRLPPAPLSARNTRS